MPPSITGHVFISYSRRDDEAMRRIVSFLRNQGIKVWLDNEKLTPGTAIWEEEIEKAINNAIAVIAVLSPDAKGSEWVRREITLTEQYKKRIFPVLVRGDENSSISLRLITRQFVDLRQNEAAGLSSLSAALHDYLSELDIHEPKADEQQPPSEPLSSRAIGAKLRDGATRGGSAKWTIPFLTGMGGILLIGATAGLMVWQLIFSPGQAKIPTNTVPPASVNQTMDTPAIVLTQTTSVQTSSNTESPMVTSMTPENAPTAENILPGSPKEGDQKTNSIDGAILIYIPPGEFTMGLTDEQKNQLCPAQPCDEIYQASQPAHRVTITYGYWMYRTEVSNAQYETCVSSGPCAAPRSTASGNQENYYGNPAFEAHPVVWVDWDQADQYCRWAGGRLPTSAEWEYAARGSKDERLYPWGDGEPDGSQANVSPFYGNTRPVNDFAEFASPFGLLNMTGNVWEWVSDWYSVSYYGDNTDNWIDPNGPSEPSTENRKVGRGGSWWIPGKFSSIAIQDWYERNDAGKNYDSVGFRCAIDQQ